MSTNNYALNDELLLCNFEDNLNIDDEKPNYIRHLWKGEWETLLKNDFNKSVLHNHNNNDILTELFKQNENQEEILCTGIASLLYFIQINFTGPVLSYDLNELNPNEIDFRSYLTIDSEEINVNTKHSELLLLTKCILEHLECDSYIKSWWYLRYVMIHQHLLDERSEALYHEMEKHVDSLINTDLNPRLKAKLCLEIGQLYLMFGRINHSDDFLQKGQHLLGMSYELTGSLGKRTKFQQTDLAQMLLQLKLNENIPRPEIKETTTPKIIPLNDEIRLDQIQYQNPPAVPLQRLPITEQSILLFAVQHLQKSRPNDQLRNEESEAFLTALLQQNNVWSLQIVALLIRCYLECDHNRTIERSLAQCELIIEQLNSDQPAAVDRLSLVWSINFQPRWKIEAQTADLMLSLGLIKASLDLYLKLQMWEEVIVCYTLMQLRHKAAEIIQNQLDSKPTVKLWCLLGDATDDITCYEKAWILSGETSARAQRHWGQYLFACRNYAESIPHLQKSLEFNSLQNMVWLRLGYAALEVEDWKLAASAYRRYTSLEPGGFEAWNNLAKAYTKLGEKNRAHFALQEALKYSFDNWRIWDNFMVVSAATSHFHDTIRSYHQILDLKEKHLDLDILFILVKEIMTNENVEEKLLTKTRELFGRLTSLHPNDSRLWELYSDLSPNAEIKAQRLFRAYRGLVQDDWSRNEEKCGQVLEICYRLGEASLESKSKSSLSSTRLTLRAVVSAAGKQSWAQHTEMLENVENTLQKIMDSCNN